MPLSSYQKLRLQQLEVPLWELRSGLGVALEEPQTELENNPQPLPIIASVGEQPTVFFCSDDAALCSETFIKDFLIGINQQTSDWQQFKAERALFKAYLTTLSEKYVAVFISNQNQSVEIDEPSSSTESSNQLGIEIDIPGTPKDLVAFKKQLWGALYQTCYH